MQSEQTFTASDAPVLADLETDNPGLKVWTSSSGDFEALTELYLNGPRAEPLAVVRPQNEAEISTVVKYAVKFSIPIAVRGGCHDYQGRSMANGALVLDMRDLNSVEVVDDGKAALVGGGILNTDLVEVLGRTGHATAMGACGTVGYAGWAMHGGYGPFSGAFGLGADQIIDARVVDCKGEVVDADDELLYGIRGAGSAFGVIISLKIKIYKLEKILAGALVYSVGNAVDDTIGGVLRKYQVFHEQGIPPELGLDIIVCNVPNVGRGLLCSIVWASEDISRGKTMVEKLHQLGQVAMDMVFETTPAGWLRAQQQNVPPQGSYATNGYMSFTVPTLDTDVRDLLVKHTKDLPQVPATLWFEHRLHGAACKPTLPSCFGYRQAHVMIEIIGTSGTKEGAEPSARWQEAFHRDARRLPQTIEGGYVPLTSREIPMELCYPEHWESLQKLKRKVDPDNVFRYSVTGLGA